MLKSYFKHTAISETKTSNAHQTESTFCLNSVLLKENCQVCFYMAELLCDKIDFFSVYSKLSSLSTGVTKISTI